MSKRGRMPADAGAQRVAIDVTRFIRVTAPPPPPAVPLPQRAGEDRNGRRNGKAVAALCHQEVEMAQKTGASQAGVKKSSPGSGTTSKTTGGKGGSGSGGGKKTK